MQKDVCLVEVPFSSFASPVFSLSLMQGALDRDKISNTLIYGNMAFAREVDLEEYIFLLSFLPQELMGGELVFSSYVFNQPLNYNKVVELLIQGGLSHGEIEKIIAKIKAQVAIVPQFIANLGDKILAFNPKIVAMASMFFQTNACLALAKYLKSKRPDIYIIIGGANCIGSAGWALVRDFPWLDVVFSGEADACFGELCTRLLQEGIPTELPYGAMTKNMLFLEDLPYDQYPVAKTEDMDNMAYPVYDDYFKALEEYAYAEEIQLSLFMEFSRGCWWNVVKGCTFCGLNPLNNGYRMKSPSRILKELAYLKERYGINRFQLTDNILAIEHIKDLLPLLVQQEEKYIFFGEIKSNTNRGQLEQLRQAGFYYVQPGIESLQDDLLDIMEKGNRGIKHVELLKNAREVGIFLIWHLLLGFPFERPEYYLELLQIIEKIGHLLPPQQCSNISFVRYSKYWQNPDKYHLKLKPTEFYELAYPGKKAFIRDAAFMYVHQEAKDNAFTIEKAACEEIKRSIMEAVNSWWRGILAKTPQRLEYSIKRDMLEIMDLRDIAKKCFIELRGLDKEICLRANKAISIEALEESLKGEYTREEITASLQRLDKDNLILRIKNEILFLATDSRATYYPPGELRGISSYNRLLKILGK